jgi:hypothetical protein
MSMVNLLLKWSVDRFKSGKSDQWTNDHTDHLTFDNEIIDHWPHIITWPRDFLQCKNWLLFSGQQFQWSVKWWPLVNWLTNDHWVTDHWPLYQTFECWPLTAKYHHTLGTINQVVSGQKSHGQVIFDGQCMVSNVKWMHGVWWIFIDHLLPLRHALYDSSLLTTDHTDRVDNDTEVYLSDCTDLLSIVHKVM